MKRAKLVLEEKTKLPSRCGVYFFYDRSGKLLYVGKARNLKQRVASYFSSPKELTPKTQILVSRISEIAFELCETEIEALIREAYHIKRLQPKFNIKLRDDKSFCYLVFSNDSFTRVFIARDIKPQIGELCGPFTDKQTLKEALKFIRNIFPFRDCKSLPKTACLQYYLGRCGAPCIKAVNKAEYLKNIRLLKNFFKTGANKIKNHLKEEMEKASFRKNFEEAAKLRDQLKLFEKLKDYQKISQREIRIREGAGAVYELYRFLKLSSKNYRIEGYDISNIMGQYATGSMVVFEDGKPQKSKYRKFKIKRGSKTDDYQMIKEVLERRFGHKEWKLPGLVVIDGGKGHLNIALGVLKNLGLKLPTIALAKKYEAIYKADFAQPLFLPKNSAALYLLQRIRDEAHRFGKRYFLTLHRKESLLSELENIPGIGPKIRKKLQKEFSSPEAIKSASDKKLSGLIGERAAQNLKKHLKHLKRT